MFMLEIFKNGICTNRAKYASSEERSAALDYNLSQNNFGLPQRLKSIADCDEEEIASSLGQEEIEGQLFHVLPAQYEIVETEIVPDYAQLRLIQYKLRVDPFLAEAITDKEAGDSTKMDEVLAEKAAIKLEFPKPE